jgi:hypothetical protein
MKRIERMSVVAAITLLLAACGTQEKVCAPDQVLSSGTCLSVQSDPKNCGAPGNACAAGQGCSAGVCVDCTQTPGACRTDVLVACVNLNQVRPLAADLTASGPPLATDAAPIKFASLSGKLFVANSLSSSISALTLSPPSSTTGAAAISIPSAVGFSDLEYLAAQGSYLWASNAAANTLVVVDPATGKVVDEFQLAQLPVQPGAFGFNPQGIAFVGTKAYLALNGSDAIAVFDVSKVPGISFLKAIDVSGLAPAGASAMPSRLLAAGSNVYVSLWGLDPMTFAPPPGSHGRLAVIDTATDRASTSPVDLGSECLNPGGMALSGTTLWVPCGFHAYNSNQVTGGALVAIEVSGSKPALPLVLPSNAAGSVAICNGRGYAGATESGTVISFDPVTSQVLNTAIACPAPTGKASYVSDVTCAQ